MHSVLLIPAQPAVIALTLVLSPRRGSFCQFLSAMPRLTSQATSLKTIFAGHCSSAPGLLMTQCSRQSSAAFLPKCRCTRAPCAAPRHAMAHHHASCSLHQVCQNLVSQRRCRCDVLPWNSKVVAAADAGVTKLTDAPCRASGGAAAPAAPVVGRHTARQSFRCPPLTLYVCAVNDVPAARRLRQTGRRRLLVCHDMQVKRAA